MCGGGGGGGEEGNRILFFCPVTRGNNLSIPSTCECIDLSLHYEYDCTLTCPTCCSNDIAGVV